MTRALPGLPAQGKRTVRRVKTPPAAQAQAVTPKPEALPDALDLGAAMLGVTALTLVGGVVARALLG